MNIFEKDFIVVPINDHQHWFVAVICFPGLEGCVRVDNNEKTEVPASQVKATEAQTLRRKKRKAGGAGSTPTKRVLQIGSTSIIPLQVRSLGQHKFKGRPSKTYAQNQYSRLRKIAKKYCELYIKSDFVNLRPLRLTSSSHLHPLCRHLPPLSCMRTLSMAP